MPNGSSPGSQRFPAIAPTPANANLGACQAGILRCAVFTFLCLTIAPFIHAAPAKRAITEKDIFDFVWIGSPEIFPDGTQVAYVRVTVNEKEGRLRHRDLVGADRARSGTASINQRPARHQPALVTGWKMDGLHARD